MIGSFRPVKREGHFRTTKKQKKKKKKKKNLKKNLKNKVKTKMTQMSLFAQSPLCTHCPQKEDRQGGW